MNKQLLRLTLSGVLAAGLTLCGAHVFAQDNNAPEQAPAQAQGMGHHHRGGMSPDRSLARMTKRYNLSTDQQTQIKPILDGQQQQMQALRQDSSLSRADRRTKMQSIHSDSNSKIEAVLNDQQKQKFDEDQQKMQQRMEQRQQNHNAAPGSDAGAPPVPPQQ